MKKKSIVIGCIIAIICLLFVPRVEARVYSTDVTATSGQEVVIKLTSNVAVTKFKIELEDAGGLEFKQAESSTAFTGKVSGSTVTGENAKVAGNTFATYTFTAPEVKETKKVTVKFKVTGMPEQEDANNTATVTINPSSKTSNTSNEITAPTTSTSEGQSTTKTLKSLKVDQGTLSPTFDKDITNYSVTVGPEVTQLKVEAVAEDTKSTVAVTGNTDFVEGSNNTVKVTVKAEDGTVRTYVIDVTKETANSLKLASLKIEGVTLSPVFNGSTYEYTTELKGSNEKLDITATANKEDAKIEILGNENLKEGDNVVTISVKSKDGTEHATYQIKVKRVAADPIASGFKLGTKEIIGASCAVVIILALFIILFIRHRRKIEEEEEEFLYSEPVYTKENELDQKEEEPAEPMQKGRTIDLSEKEQTINRYGIEDLEDTKKIETPHEENTSQKREETLLNQGTGRFDRELDYMFHVTDDVEDVVEDEKKRKKKKGKHF